MAEFLQLGFQLFAWAETGGEDYSRFYGIASAGVGYACYGAFHNRRMFHEYALDFERTYAETAAFDYIVSSADVMIHTVSVPYCYIARVVYSAVPNARVF